MDQASQILVVENDSSVAKSLLALLGSKGYKADLVVSGQQALERANSHTDLILLDLVLPDDDGFRICYLLKCSPKTKHIPIIILSGRDHKGDKLQSFHLGADDFISKPVQPEDLFARVQAVLSRSQILTGSPDRSFSYEMIQELHKIVEEKRVVPFFQPIYFLKPMRLFGFEALCRTEQNSMFTNPEVLFKAALHFGFYFELEMLVWRKAIEIARHTFEKEHLFLNCSPHLIESHRGDEIKGMFKGFSSNERHVYLELTERSAISEFEKFFQYLSNYRWHGFRIAIDDVGAGYSSLESIVQTKPEVVKIDHQIVTGLSDDPFKRSIIKLIVAFCREHGIICIAEGIETQEDLETLIELDVQAGQGYYLCRPTDRINLNAMRAISV